MLRIFGALCLFCVGALGGAQLNAFQLLSKAPVGMGSDAGGMIVSYSYDGRRIMFYSGASNYIPGDTNGQSDLYTYDIDIQKFRRVNIGPKGDVIPTTSGLLSGNGRVVAFNAGKVYIRNLENLVTEMVSFDLGGLPLQASLIGMTTDGNRILYGGSGRQLLVRDRRLARTFRVVTKPNGESAMDYYAQPMLSADGSAVWFVSSNVGLPHVAGNTYDLYRQSVDTGEIVLKTGNLTLDGQKIYGPTPVNTSADGTKIYVVANSSSLCKAAVLNDTTGVWTILPSTGHRGIDEGYLGSGRISADGSAVAAFFNTTGLGPCVYRFSTGQFTRATSTPSSLISYAGIFPNKNGSRVAFMSRAIPMGTGIEVSYAIDGADAQLIFRPDLGGGARTGSIYYGGMMVSATSDGKTVIFDSEGQNLAPAIQGQYHGVLALDRTTGAYERVSNSNAGGLPDGICTLKLVSSNARYVAFLTAAMNIVGLEGDSYVVYDRQTHQNIYHLNGFAAFQPIALSNSGKFTFGTLDALVGPDMNRMQDIYRFNPATATYTLLSKTPTGGNVNSGVFDAAVPTDNEDQIFMLMNGSDIGQKPNYCYLVRRDLVAQTTQVIKAFNATWPAPNWVRHLATSANGQLVGFPLTKVGGASVVRTSDLAEVSNLTSPDGNNGGPDGLGITGDGKYLYWRDSLGLSTYIREIGTTRGWSLPRNFAIGRITNAGEVIGSMQVFGPTLTPLGNGTQALAVKLGSPPTTPDTVGFGYSHVDSLTFQQYVYGVAWGVPRDQVKIEYRVSPTSPWTPCVGGMATVPRDGKYDVQYRTAIPGGLVDPSPFVLTTSVETAAPTFVLNTPEIGRDRAIFRLRASEGGDAAVRIWNSTLGPSGFDTTRSVEIPYDSQLVAKLSVYSLQPNTTYQYEVKVMDSGGAVTTQSGSFTTPP